MPWRHSLVIRLLAASVLIAIAAIAATAWLATRTATRAINQEQGRSLTGDKGVYDMLVAYAAGHPDWSEAPELVHQRAAELGRRITLMTEDREVIIDSGPGPSLRAARPSAVIDPLNLDLGLTGGTERIDERAVGPYLLPASERAELRDYARRMLNCLTREGVGARIMESPTGRPSVQVISPDPDGARPRCGADLDVTATATERKALRTLGTMTSACLGGVNGGILMVSPQFSDYILSNANGDRTVVSVIPGGVSSETGTTRIRSCLEKSRRTQLQPYVAPPALLFVTDPDTGADRTTFTLSRGNTIRIVAVTGAVLLATILVTVLAGRRLVRPLRALAEAAGGSGPVIVTGRDEIGHLARALNDSAERRDRAEAQRRAMVADVAHELRTPLTNIRGWLEAAQDDIAPTDAQLVALLHEEALLLQHVIEDLSDLAAVDAGTLRVHPEEIPVRDVVGQVVDIHVGTAHTAGVRLETVAVGDPVLFADPVRIRQVVGNLVSNAIRYTPPGGTVTVTVQEQAILVRDTGIGISAEHLPRVFDRFWRADESRSRTTGGSGLGLAITRKLVEAHGGAISVESTPGQGTLFTVRLPPGA
ncbi:two-component system, OmpR family, sensor histidine kinase BaeS [Actinoplanes derwentensis]|uniref:histidine kinase n=1 Tax=Actinoplanes derwentensis TaxID=113562 RepID=A0A1H1UL55_9ACTN|nr:two-component system, OmpR family, sensor histidine kinase BaeS [Actinoplanes derwentensis]